MAVALRSSGVVGVHNADAASQKVRRYVDCQLIFGAHLKPCVQPQLEAGEYLLHHQPYGKPHCECLTVQADGTHTIRFHTSAHAVSADVFVDCWQRAVDRKALVAFQLCRRPVDQDFPTHRLLMLQAGACSRHLS